MLTRLHIRDFAIIPTLEQEFEPGFTAISGETGAGKSILVDALGLLLGARSDSGWVRTGADRAELTAEFDLANNAEALAWLRRTELDDNEACLVRRTIRSNGRSSAWVNGTPVTVQQLAELGDQLVEVHGQNEHVRLRGRRRQLELLDRTGAYEAELAQVAAAFEQWRDLDDRLAQLESGHALPPGEAEFLRHQLTELETHALAPEELAELEREHRRLSGAGELLQALDTAVGCLEAEQHGAMDALARARSSLQRFEEFDGAIGEARTMLQEALINAQEAARTLQAVGDRVELSPERLRQVGDTLSTLGDLARKHGVDLEDLTAVRDRIAERLERADSSEEQRDRLGRERTEALTAYRDAAAALGARRREHAQALSQQVEAAMKRLGMAGGRFLVQFEEGGERAPSAFGEDRVELLVSANPGTPPGPLARIASGGELSRISLAIKVVGSVGDGRTQVYDEVDAGVGGDTANAVGELLRRTADGGQALCVTHLPQVAVRADHQLRVSKTAGNEQTRVDAQALDARARIDEIARMLGGGTSERSRAHAREMLESARS